MFVPQGDSGGPMVCGNVLAGVTSWGASGCNTTAPTVYTRYSYKQCDLILMSSNQSKMLLFTMQIVLKNCHNASNIAFIFCVKSSFSGMNKI